MFHILRQFHGPDQSPEKTFKKSLVERSDNSFWITEGNPLFDGCGGQIEFTTSRLLVNGDRLKHHSRRVHWPRMSGSNPRSGRGQGNIRITMGMNEHGFISGDESNFMNQSDLPGPKENRAEVKRVLAQDSSVGH